MLEPLCSSRFEVLEASDSFLVLRCSGQYFPVFLGWVLPRSSSDAAAAPPSFCRRMKSKAKTAQTTGRMSSESTNSSQASPAQQHLS